MGKIFSILQRVGRSFMLPIALLPVAGLFLGVGGSFTNTTTLETYGLMNLMGPGTAINALLTVMNDAGNIVFANLPILFAMSVAIGMAKQEKAIAALSGAIAFFVMHASTSAMLKINGTDKLLDGAVTSVLGIQSLQMGVFGGVIVGLGVAVLHNRFYKIELPPVLAFFGGTKFVPIISATAFLFVGILMYFVWPPIQSIIFKLGDLVLNSGYAGTWIYGIIERALIPFGLHHVFYMPMWYTAVGGTATIGGQVIEGAQNIFFAELAAPGITHFSVSATRFMTGKFPFMIFGLPGAALAMYKCAKPEKQKVVGGLLMSAALTSLLTGITEPIEFTFLFVAPFLYAVHCIFAGLSFMLMHLLNVGVGMTFSGGFIDMFLYGILQGNAKTNWIYIVFVGIGYFIVYYFMFGFLIKKFDLKTPGRDDGEEEVKLYTKADVNAKRDAIKRANDSISPLIVKGLGGIDNISDIDYCVTRLRTSVFDDTLVNEDILKSTGASGVLRKGKGIQVVFGPRVSIIKANLDAYLDDISKQMVNGEPKADAKDITVYAPLEGKVVTLKDVNDGVFSAGMLGEGLAIEPTVGKVVAPFDGEVAMVYATKHAIAVRSNEGLELLIHVGLDTVQLNGECYDIKVKDGQKVKKGDLLAEFDMAAIQAKGYRTITPMVITNPDEFKGVTKISGAEVKFGDSLFTTKG